MRGDGGHGPRPSRLTQCRPLTSTAVDPPAVRWMKPFRCSGGSDFRKDRGWSGPPRPGGSAPSRLGVGAKELSGQGVDHLLGLLTLSRSHMLTVQIRRIGSRQRRFRSGVLGNSHEPRRISQQPQRIRVVVLAENNAAGQLRFWRRTGSRERRDAWGRAPRREGEPLDEGEGSRRGPSTVLRVLNRTVQRPRWRD